MSNILKALQEAIDAWRRSSGAEKQPALLALVVAAGRACRAGLPARDVPALTLADAQAVLREAHARAARVEQITDDLFKYLDEARQGLHAPGDGAAYSAEDGALAAIQSRHELWCAEWVFHSAEAINHVALRDAVNSLQTCLQALDDKMSSRPEAWVTTTVHLASYAREVNSPVLPWWLDGRVEAAADRLVAEADRSVEALRQRLSPRTRATVALVDDNTTHVTWQRRRFRATWTVATGRLILIDTISGLPAIDLLPACVVINDIQLELDDVDASAYLAADDIGAAATFRFADDSEDWEVM